MSAPTGAAPNVARRKALGQYLTGVPLARLLLALARTEHAPTSVADPMVGTGDMLAAARHLYGPAPQLVGVDIDRLAAEAASARFHDDPAAVVRAANAFSPEIWAELEWPQFGLVVTNPPYVRYQTLARAGTHDLPTGQEVRAGLRRVVATHPHLTDDDRALFVGLTDGYSGLSDLAVPSWILCAALVAPGGTLAMVVPETWLSRAYARPIQWLLSTLFRVRCVVEDAGHAWFTEALVKTHLVVADRVDQTEDPSAGWRDASYVFVSLPPAQARGSMVGGLYPEAADPDRAFAEDIAKLAAGDVLPARLPFVAEHRDLGYELAPVAGMPRTSNWLAGQTTRASASSVPHALRRLVAPGTELVTLDEFGVRVGQGLRTGANPFFYVDAVGTDGDAETVLVRVHRAVGGGIVPVPLGALLPVLRAQAELPSEELTLDPTTLTGRVLVLDGWALPEDIEQCARAGGPLFSIMPELRLVPDALADHLRRAAGMRVGQGLTTPIPQLSAVQTNVNVRAGRFWYHLPPLTDRHRPDLLIPRVNYRTPRVWLNPERSAVVDANFSTLWVPRSANVGVAGLLAMLASRWARTAMELAGTVMGGGALKLEAAHLRRLPLPRVPPRDVDRLDLLGAKLAAGDPGALNEIDALVARVLAPGGGSADLIEALTEIGDQAARQRNNAANGA